MKKVFIGLGSNLDDPLSQLKKAIEYLKQHEMLNVINISSFYSSPPMGPQDQPDFINAVVEIATSLSAEQLLDELQKIEHQQGRERKQHWGARTLDLDILLYGSEVINTERLIVPHRGISERSFVLYPLNDLVEKNFRIPGLGKISELLVACPMIEITRLSEV